MLFFFRIFFPRLSLNGNRDKNFFFLSFSAYLRPFWLQIIPERDFFIFWFFFYFFRNFLSRAEYERNSGLKFFFLFLGLSHPVLARNNPGKKFFNFFNFFWEFSSPGQVWTEFGSKIFFSLFFGRSPPILAKNNARKSFFKFFIRFCFCFWNFFARVGYEQNSELNFFFLFLGLFHPILARNNPGKRFFNFINFFAIFFGNSLPRAKYERNSGLKFFFPLFFGRSTLILVKSNVGKRFFNFFDLFFAIVFGIFLPGLGTNRIQN